MKKIVVLAGDGIGPEIMTSALQIVKACLPSNPYFSLSLMHLADKPLSSMAHHCQKTLQACQQADAILLGAIGDPKWENAAYTPEKGLLDLRRALDLYANIRPIKVTDAFYPFLL